MHDRTRIRFHLTLEINDLLDLVEEEHVDARDVADTGVVNAQPHQLRDRIDTVIGTFLDVLEKIIDTHMLGVELRHVDVVLAVLERADRFQKALFKSSADTHDLTGRLHLCREFIHRRRELIERESRHLRNNIVERRFEAGRSIGKLDLVQIHADRDLRRDTGDRVTAGLRSQCGRSRYTGIDLDDIVLKGVRVERELAVTSAFNTERTDDLQRTVTEHVIFLIRQCL